MILRKTIRSSCFHTLLSIQSPAICQKNPLFIPAIPSTSSDFFIPYVFWRPFSLSSLFARKLEQKREKSVEPLSVHSKGAGGLSERRDKSVEPLSVHFKGAVGLSERRDKSVEPLSVHFKGAVGLSERRDKKSALNAKGDSANTKLRERIRKKSALNAKSDSANTKLRERIRKKSAPDAKGDSADTELRERTRKKSALNAKGDSANAELRGRIRKLEEVRSLKEKKCEEGATPNPPSKNVEEIGANRSLLAIFGDSKIEEVKLTEPTDSPTNHGGLSLDMQTFAHHLYLKGYLKDANFMTKDKFDLTPFEQSHGRDFLKFAAVKFALDHSKIAKCLSASDLKKVALFGCPSAERRSAYASKSVRAYFEINELEVCQKCTLKKSCKHAKQQPRRDGFDLKLHKVIRVLIMYALESVPQELVVPKEVKTSASRLLKEIINLTQSGS